MNNTLKYLLIATIVFMNWPTMTQAYEVMEVKEGATISGKVMFLGNPPSPLQIEVEKNPEVCGQQRSLVKVETENGLLKGAVIILEGIKSGKPFAEQVFRGSAPGRGTFKHRGGEILGLEVNTENCNFGPLTGVITADESVRFSNGDSVKHVLHTFVSMDSRGSVLRTLHNRDIQPGKAFNRTFDSEKLKESRLVRVICNRHDFMQNWLYVVNNPYFAISDSNGQFAIEEIPSGQYILRVWHPTLGIQEQKVQVGPDETLQTEITFSE